MSIERISKLFEAIQVEREHAIQEFEQHLTQIPLQQRCQQGFSFYPVQYLDEELSIANRPLFTFQHPNLLKNKSVETGQVVSIFTLQELPKHVSKRFQGVVFAIHNDKIQVLPYSEEVPDWLHEGKIGIDLYFDERTFQLMEQALHQLTTTSDRRVQKLIKIAFDNEKPRFEPEFPLHLPNLNASQNQAAMKCLTAKDLAIIHGPPGTGKTTTLVEAIVLMLKQNKPILVTAPSNHATDVLAKKLLQKGIKVIRVGSPARMDSSLWEYTVESTIRKDPLYPLIKDLRKRALNEKQQALKFKRNFGQAEREARQEGLKNFKQLLNDARETENQILKNLLSETEVFCATLTGSAHPILEGIRFHTVVIDEAAQALEPACWIALLKAERVILAGDHFQLPPTVKAQKAKQLGLETTLFERLIKLYPEAATLLNTQYRAHPHIMNFSSAAFYEHQLRTAEHLNHYTYNGETPITFIDTAGCGFEEVLNEESLSFHNPDEARVLLTYLKQFLDTHQVQNLGIISPYKEQTIMLQEQARALELPNISTDTVDGFQGEEREVIAISMVRSNPEGNIGFLQDIRRTNVAITRAQKKLVIVGDSATLAAHPFYHSLINYLNEFAEYRSAWEFME